MICDLGDALPNARVVGTRPWWWHRPPQARRQSMKTILTVALLVLTSVAIATAADIGPRRTVDLDAPGAMERVRAANPSHFDKIVKIIEGVARQPDSAVPRWMRVNFDAQDVNYRPIVMTSYPPKRRLSFALDDTRYEAVVVLTNASGA